MIVLKHDYANNPYTKHKKSTLKGFMLVYDRVVYLPILPIFLYRSSIFFLFYAFLMQSSPSFLNDHIVLNVISFLSIGRDKPLCLYMFIQNEQDRDAIIANTSSGGICVNDALTHFAG